jgi:CheY-like chemotaxis protein
VFNKTKDALYIDADPARLEQIFTNLLTNSAKYTKPSGLITLTALREAGSASIHIRDNGVGIPKNMLDRIFEPFFQINRTRLENANQGIGVGLHLTRNLVEMHGGTIEATSAGPDTGSEFIVRLPLSSNPPPGAKAQRRKPRPSRVLPSSQKILVVDDNKSAAQTLSQMLELLGHTVQIAYNGSEAVQKALLFKPNSVILDIGLPDMNGYKVAEQLQNHGRRYFLIALTGYGQPEDKVLAKQTGFHYHLTKPAGIKDIEAVLEKIPKSILSA